MKTENSFPFKIYPGPYQSCQIPSRISWCAGDATRLEYNVDQCESLYKYVVHNS